MTFVLAFLWALFICAALIFGTLLLLCLSLCALDGIIGKVRKLRRIWNR